MSMPDDQDIPLMHKQIADLRESRERWKLLHDSQLKISMKLLDEVDPLRRRVAELEMAAKQPIVGVYQPKVDDLGDPPGMGTSRDLVVEVIKKQRAFYLREYELALSAKDHAIADAWRARYMTTGEILDAIFHQKEEGT